MDAQVQAQVSQRNKMKSIHHEPMWHCSRQDLDEKTFLEYTCNSKQRTGAGMQVYDTSLSPFTIFGTPENNFVDMTGEMEII